MGFAVMDAPSLHRLAANPRPFSKYLAASSGRPVARAFANLGGDALLVAPANATERPADYPHLAAFVRGGAPPDQIEATWAELSKAIDTALERHEMVWVNTSGLRTPALSVEAAA